MNDLEQRLTKCFSTVFPAVPPADIAGASMKTVKEWDSAAAITLVMVMEEEFGISLDFEVLPELDSFRKIASYLGTRQHEIN